jgi:hypothetical protein
MLARADTSDLDQNLVVLYMVWFGYLFSLKFS